MARTVLLINGSSGGSSRRVTVPVGDPITVALNAAPAGPADGALYALWVWPGSCSEPFSLDLGTSVAGSTVNPTPLQPFATPQPALCLMSSAMPAVFCSGAKLLNSPPDAPWSVTKGSGFNGQVSFILQGILEDLGSPGSDGLSTTNAVILRVE